MKQTKQKAALCFALSFIMLASNMVLPAQAAEETNWRSAVKDHWNFDSLTSDMGDKTTGTLHGAKIVKSQTSAFGNVLKFGAGADNYFKLEDYINTGKGETSFSMWYRYDVTIEGDDANKAAVLLQQEGDGHSLLTLRPNGSYHTYINQSDVYSKEKVEKGQWQHITVTFDQDTNKVAYYINGKLDSVQKMGKDRVDQILSLRLGAHKKDGNLDPHPLRGEVDEFYVYNRALNAQEAKAVYEEKAKELSGAQDVVNLTVKPDTVIRTIEPDSIFGINHRYAFNGYGTFDAEQMKMKDAFTALYKDAGFGSIRYPGGTISNLFNWKTTIGPKEKRKKQIHGFYNNKGQGGIEPNFGLKELADFASEVNSEIVYVYSLGRGNAQDASDLIEYLNAKVGTNPNGGIDWAAVRAENGHEAPYNVRYFEIGNEMQQAYGNSDGTASQGYWTTYVEGGHAKAYTQGGVAKFVQKYAVDEENWNKEASQSDGSPNLVRYLRYANLNPGKLVNGEIIDDPDFKAVNDGVQVFVGTDGKLEAWQVVANFENSSPADKHCVIDYSTGAIRFGDGQHGKIPEKGKNIYATYTVNREGFLDVSKAIKQTTDKINEIEGTKHQANVYTSHESEDFINEMNRLDANAWYDGMTIHPYSDTVDGKENSELFYDNAMKRAEEAGIKKVQHYLGRLPEGKVPVISEYGIFRNTEPQVRSQTHAVYIAKVLMEYVRMGSPYIQKHCLADWYSAGADSLGPTQQAVIQVVPQKGASNTATGEGEFKFFATPSAHVFKMLNAGFGENIIETELDQTPHMNNGVQSLSALASADAEGNLYIALVNVDRERDQTVALHLDGVNLEGRTMDIQRLESETITDENTLEAPDKVAVTTEQITAAADQTLTVKKHSFVVVKISGNA